jgi:hypothetical protein
MNSVLLIMFWVAGSVAVVALVIAQVMRRADERAACGGHRSDEEIHDRHAEVEIEPGEVEDMLDAIVKHRRRAGRRDIGEQLAEELLPLRRTRRAPPDGLQGTLERPRGGRRGC